jgi:hypothetical protein
MVSQFLTIEIQKALTLGGAAHPSAAFLARFDDG